MVEGCLLETYGVAGFHLGEQRQVDADDIRNAGIASGGLPVGHEDDGLSVTGYLNRAYEIPAEMMLVCLPYALSARLRAGSPYGRSAQSPCIR